MQARYQNGCLTTITRKDGIERWQLRWRSRRPDGTLRPCKKTIGPVCEYPEKSKKLQDLLASLRMTINTEAPTKLNSMTIGALVEHYENHELADNGEEGKAHSTRNRLSSLLERWILPRWRRSYIGSVKAIAVEAWLKTLVSAKSKNSKPKRLAPGSKAKIRNCMGALYNHAIRWEFTDKNPITGPVKGSGVRQSSKRQRIPDILEVEEMQRLIAALQVRERALTFLDMVTGLRRGELAGLK